MHRIYSTVIEMIAASAFVVPLSFLYDRLSVHNLKRTFLYILFALYLAAVLALVGFPDITFLTVEFTVNVIPVVDMASDFTNTFLNILLFIPFGMFLPLLWNGFRTVKSTARMGLLVACVIEISQIFTHRATDINDLITNTVGTIIGYYIVRWATGSFTGCIVSGSESKDFYIVSGSVCFIMFLLQPFVSSYLWGIIL